MRYLTLGEVLRLHADVVASSGGAGGVRDLGRVQSALAQPMATFDGEELYPSVIEKAGSLGFALIQGHAFIDGNKRIGHAALYWLFAATEPSAMALQTQLAKHSALSARFARGRAESANATEGTASSARRYGRHHQPFMGRGSSVPPPRARAGRANNVSGDRSRAGSQLIAHEHSLKAKARESCMGMFVEGPSRQFDSIEAQLVSVRDGVRHQRPGDAASTIGRVDNRNPSLRRGRGRG